MPNKTSISSRLEGDVLIVTATGDLTLELPRDLRLFVESKVAEGTTKLILDLSGVGFVNSMGIGTLVAIFQQLSNAGGEVMFLASPRLFDLIKMTKLDRIIKVVSSVEEGLTLLSS